MRTRSVLAAGVALALLVAPATGAVAKTAAKPKPKPKVYCNLLVDAANDGTSSIMPAVHSADLDILSADIATGPKTMVAVLRLGGTNFNASSDPWSFLGYSWKFGAESSLGQVYNFSASVDYGNPVNSGATVDGVGVHADFVVDHVKNTFTWTIKRSDVPSLGRPKNVFHSFYADSYFESASADSTAATPASDIYPDKALSCVHAS